MKLPRLLASFAVLVGLLIMGSPAQAAVTWVSVNHWGVVCQEATNDVYPADGTHFYYCGSNNTDRDSYLAMLQSVMNDYPDVYAKNFGVARFAIFNNVVDQKIFASPTQPSQAQKDQWYADALQAATTCGATYGVTDDTGTRQTTVYETVPESPGPWSTKDVGLNKHTLLHELGHNYDAGRGFPSNDGIFKTLVEKDNVYMDSIAPRVPPAPSGATKRGEDLRVDTPHILLRSSAPEWKEIYAEQFAAKLIADHPTYGATKIGVITDALQPYYGCSARWVKENADTGNNPTSPQLQAIGCTATTTTIVCKEYHPGTDKGYPAWGGNVVRFDAYACGKEDGTNTPTLTRQQNLYDALSTELNKPANSAVLANLKANGARVKYYFFRNRADANDFFDKQKPFSASASYQSTASSERCGHTSYVNNSATNVITVAIYDSCALSTGDVGNTDLLRTAIYETGRAYALSFLKLGGADPSATSGFSNMTTADTLYIPANWNVYTNANKDAFLCPAFGSIGNSQLEKDMGAPTAAPPASPTNSGPVCTSNVVNNPWKTGGTGGAYRTQKEIAVNDKKIPSQILSVPTKVWQEEFAVLLLGTAPISTMLPVTDTFVGAGARPTVGGQAAQRPMNCTRLIVESYRTNGTKPSGSSLSAAGCPADPEYP